MCVCTERFETIDTTFFRSITAGRSRLCMLFRVSEEVNSLLHEGSDRLTSMQSSRYTCSCIWFAIYQDSLSVYKYMERIRKITGRLLLKVCFLLRCDYNTIEILS